MKIITLIIVATISSLIAGPVLMEVGQDSKEEIILNNQDHVVLNEKEEVVTYRSADARSGDTVPEITTTTVSLEQFIANETAEHGQCGQWHDLAISIGWPEEEWPTLSYVLFRESRCNVDSHNKTDPSSGSRGLMQINGFWCRPNRWTDHGWLQDNGILNTCDDLFNAEINLRAGLAIWKYGEEKHGCGWRGPWATKCQ